MESVTTTLTVLLVLSAFVFSFCAGVSDAVCHESERQALLRFKQDLTDPSNRLASWTDGGNCCDWAGVVCENLTGHVSELHLGNPNSQYYLYQDVTEFETYTKSQLGGKLNASLVNLKHLNYLDLSDNDFRGIPIPTFLGSIGSLIYLELSRARFGGMIHHQLGNLSNLRHLNLRNDFSSDLESHLYVQNLQWLSNLQFLQFLDISEVDLSQASDWLQGLSKLSSLVELRLSYCGLDSVSSSPIANNLSSLAILDLSYNGFSSPWILTWAFNLNSLISLNFTDNDFEGPIPDGLRNMTSLRNLSLAQNYFNSSIPDWLFSFSHLKFLDLNSNNLRGTISYAIGNLTSAVTIDLSGNNLEGNFPVSLGNLCNLKSIHLSGTKFRQDIGEVLEILTGCVSNGLESLHLGYCQLSGHLTRKIGRFKKLAALSLRGNSISGQIPESLRALTSLKFLTLSENLFTGTLPEWLGNLTKLEILKVTRNLLEGVVSEAHFMNLTMLTYFSASGNSLIFKMSSDWVPPPQLFCLMLSSCHLGTGFPLWLRLLRNLSVLDLSHTGIQDTVPAWFWNLSSQFWYLNLSHNHIHGQLPDMLTVIPIPDATLYPFSEIDLNSNYIDGPLPRLSSNITVLDLSNNSFSGSISHFLCYKIDKPKMMRVLHLEVNLLSGEIPDCWMNWQNLVFLGLGNNSLTGNIPSSMGSLNSLSFLHLGNNNLSGALPLSLQNCTALLALDLGENKFVGSIPGWIGERLSNLKFLRFRSNIFGGHIPIELCELSSLQVLDLAHNNLSGNIPTCFLNFSAIATKQNSSDRIAYWMSTGDYNLESAFLVIKGSMREYSSNLHLVTSIDLSDNILSGGIPVEITLLAGLISLNLSMNLLTGKIPDNVGNMGSLESLDISLNQLSGVIPPSMAKLTFLSFLNLSYNNLAGKIPTSTQLQTFNASSFVGNSLCGPPLSDNCSSNGETPNAEKGHKNRGPGVDGFYVSFAMGIVVGFFGLVGPLLYNKSWRFAYFQWLDRTLDGLWVYLHLHIRKDG